MAGVGDLARWERGGRVDQGGRPALCVETSGGGGEGKAAGARGRFRALRPLRFRFRPHRETP